MKKKPDFSHIPKLDDYELKPEYTIDYRKAKPNPFAGRVVLPRRRARPGVKRKFAPEPVERHTITLYRTHAKYLRTLDGNLSRAIRKLIAKKAR
jgi:hypothetical protein